MRDPIPGERMPSPPKLRPPPKPPRWAKLSATDESVSAPTDSVTSATCATRLTGDFLESAGYSCDIGLASHWSAKLLGRSAHALVAWLSLVALLLWPGAAGRRSRLGGGRHFFFPFWAIRSASGR